MRKLQENTYALKARSLTCIDCPSGYTTWGKTTNIMCQKCPAGKVSFNSVEQTKNSVKFHGKTKSNRRTGLCYDCPAGYYRSFTDDPTKCKSCSKGMYTNSTGMTMCLDCIPGRANNITRSSSCIDCKANTYTKKFKSHICITCPLGYSSTSSSASCQKCVAGEAGIGINGACEMCPTGWYRGHEDDPTQCIMCELGETTKPGVHASSCGKCDIGRFGKTQGTCEDCPLGLYADSKGQTECSKCSEGKVVNKHSTACEKPVWTTEADCELGEYLDNFEESKFEHDCERHERSQLQRAYTQTRHSSAPGWLVDNSQGIPRSSKTAYSFLS